MAGDYSCRSSHNESNKHRVSFTLIIEGESSHGVGSAQMAPYYAIKEVARRIKDNDPTLSVRLYEEECGNVYRHRVPRRKYAKFWGWVGRWI